MLGAVGAYTAPVHPMTTDPRQLALKMQEYIGKQSSPVSFTMLQERATGHGISDDVFMSAIEHLHRWKWIARTVHGDDIRYAIKIEKPKVAQTFTRNYPYPEMNETNNAKHEIFDGLDLSWMFMKPDDAEAYWQSKKPVWVR